MQNLQMNNYFIVDTLDHMHNFVNVEGHSMFLEWHAVPVDDNAPTGKQLVVARFLHEGITEKWINVPGVTPLPHPMNHSKPVHPDHHALLKDKFGIEPTDTVWHVAHKASKIGGNVFKLSAFF